MVQRHAGRRARYRTGNHYLGGAGYHGGAGAGGGDGSGGNGYSLGRGAVGQGKGSRGEVIVGGREFLAVNGYARNVGYGVEQVGQDDVGGVHVAVVIQVEGIGYGVAAGGAGTHGLNYAHIGVAGHGQGIGNVHRLIAVAGEGEGGGIFDGSAGRKVRVLVDLGLVNDDSVAARRKAGNGEHHLGSLAAINLEAGGENAVDIEIGGAHIGEGIYRTLTASWRVRAEVICDSDLTLSGAAVVAEGEDIGYFIIGAVRSLKGGFGSLQRVLKGSRRHIGGGYSPRAPAVQIGQAGLVRDLCCHCISPEILRFVATLHPMPCPRKM